MHEGQLPYLQHQIVLTKIETLFIKSRVTTAINTTSGALHALSTIVLRWLHRVIIHHVARASVMFWMLFLHSFSHPVFSNLLNVLSNDDMLIYYHLC